MDEMLTFLHSNGADYRGIWLDVESDKWSENVSINIEFLEVLQCFTVYF